MQLSFLIPAYNVEKYINGCLNSIIKQPHFGEYELIIRNDGSTDNTLNIINEYAKKYKNIKVLTGENVGTLKCRELLVKEANSEYCWFIDSDDEITDNAIESILKTCDDWKIDFDCMFLKYINLKNNKLIKSNRMNQIFKTNNLYKFTFKHWRFLFICLWTKVVKTNILKKIYNNCPIFHGMEEDNAPGFAINLFSKKILFNSNICYYYNIHSESISNKKNILKNEINDEILNMVKYTFNLLPNEYNLHKKMLVRFVRYWKRRFTKKAIHDFLLKIK